MLRSYEWLLVAGIVLSLAGLMGMAAVSTDGGGSESWGIGCAGVAAGVALVIASVAVYYRPPRPPK
ncbi:MAG: hypothetical protein JNL18_19075 [Planctomycetaceae bacterium]|nr:hypothetical protein [Planctomycetaceae bacterium]